MRLAFEIRDDGRASAAEGSRRRRGGIASTPRGLVASIPWSGRAAAAGRSPRRAPNVRRVPTVDFGAGADEPPRRDVVGNYKKAPLAAAGGGGAAAGGRDEDAEPLGGGRDVAGAAGLKTPTRAVRGGEQCRNQK